jgi:hypothetical protein
VARDLTFVSKTEIIPIDFTPREPSPIANVGLSGAQGLRAPAVALLTGNNRLGAAGRTLKRFDQPGLSQQDAAALAEVMKNKPQSDVPMALKVGAGILIAALVIRGVRGGS